MFDRLAKNGGASGARRGSGALETLTSPRAVSAARSSAQPNDEAFENRRNDVKRGALTKIKDLVRPFRTPTASLEAVEMIKTFTE